MYALHTHLQPKRTNMFRSSNATLTMQSAPNFDSLQSGYTYPHKITFSQKGTKRAPSEGSSSSRKAEPIRHFWRLPNSDVLSTFDIEKADQAEFIRLSISKVRRLDRIIVQIPSTNRASSHQINARITFNTLRL